MILYLAKISYQSGLEIVKVDQNFTDTHAHRQTDRQTDRHTHTRTHARTHAHTHTHTPRPIL